ncbi:hypothetical protein AALO_G00219990 [Alosa alosa]|uniref:Uncharacterized protein n=1 Tax=Alosa alosa TaxID=278164 RepID=A0AAV6FXJ5_9TELE|nr:hypothetical protein AALO_G00219990 [Alosa alosa]
MERLPAPPPPPPRLIQRMESGYESSERNSNSPVSMDMPLHEAAGASTHRDMASKRSLTFGPSWRSVPKSKSSSAILQELPSPSWARTLTGPGGLVSWAELQEEVARRPCDSRSCRSSWGEGGGGCPGLQPQTQQVHGPGRAPAPGEQPGPLQVLLTKTPHQLWDTNQDAALALPSRSLPQSPTSTNQVPSFSQSHTAITSPASTQQSPNSHVVPGSHYDWPSSAEEAGLREDERWEGIRLSDILQASGVSIRPLRKHLAISLPSLPLDAWSLLGRVEQQSQAAGPDGPPPPPPPAPQPPRQEDGEKRGRREEAQSRDGENHLRLPLWHPLNSAPQRSPGLSRASPSPLTPPRPTSHWSSWSLDRPDAVVTPYMTPPDSTWVPCSPASETGHSFSSRTQGSMSCPDPWSRTPDQGREMCSAPDRSTGSGADLEPVEQELSELDSLYQASLMAQSSPASALPAAGPRTVAPAARKLMIGRGRSRTPTAEIERSAYGPPGCPRPPTWVNNSAWGLKLEQRAVQEGEGDGDQMRHFARSLSGTVIGPHHTRLALSRSFKTTEDQHVFCTRSDSLALPPALTGTERPELLGTDLC